jgi:hypothetical protein
VLGLPLQPKARKGSPAWYGIGLAVPIVSQPSIEEDAMPNAVKARENRLRRKAARQGLALGKSRVVNPHWDDHGAYMIIDLYGNYIVAGSRFDMGLEEVERYLADD